MIYTDASGEHKSRSAGAQHFLSCPRIDNLVMQIMYDLQVVGFFCDNDNDHNNNSNNSDGSKDNNNNNNQ